MDSHKVEVGKSVTILALRQLIRDWRTNESLDILLTYTLSPTQRGDACTSFDSHQLTNLLIALRY